MTQPCKTITAQELATLDLFKDDEPAALEWLAERFEVRCYEAGEEVIRPGEPAREFNVLLEGEVHIVRDGDVYGGAFIRLPGQPSGVLPFSRMTVFRGRGWAVKPSRGIFMNASHLPEMVSRAPHLTQKLVNEMIDRSREITKRDERANKMLALGKLSAGLAHELNNPASAVVRSSARLREVLVERRTHAIGMRNQPVSPEAQKIILELSDIVSDSAKAPLQMDALERADLESELYDWLDTRKLSAATAGALIDAGIRVAHLDPLSKLLSCEALDHGLHMLAADQEVTSLSREIEEASRRIADLVGAVKSYSYMDRVPGSEVDVEQGILVTLRMFQHHLKHGYEVKKLFAGDLPKIRANGGELNQIWTNLIDNAIDAMRDSPSKVLGIRTCTELNQVLVEISDSGSGIPADILPNIFDAFFTTKDVGKGTGLGLDIVQSIVHAHQGSIRVTSKPGNTVFQVRLPIEGAGR